MLYNLTFTACNLTLPLAHHAKVQGMIYALMGTSPDYSAFIHNQGYSVGGARFKLFTFSNLVGPHTVRQGMITFPHKVSFALRTADPVFGQILHTLLRPGLVCTLNGQEITLSSVQQESIQLDNNCQQVKIRMLSPITVYRSLPDGHTQPFNPLEEEFSQLVNQNYHSKWQSATGEAAGDDVELVALSVGRHDKLVTKIKGTYVTAWGGTYLLKGKPRAMEFLYHTGLGAKNSMGFGAFEIIG